MIFRRFAGSLRRQDWTAVVVELVVVVLGVFIGLQAANWNEDRQTDRRVADFNSDCVLTCARKRGPSSTRSAISLMSLPMRSVRQTRSPAANRCMTRRC